MSDGRRALPTRVSGAGASGDEGSLRPRIYVYELPVRFNLWLMETRMHPQDCAYRRYTGAHWGKKGGTQWENYAFGLESAWLGDSNSRPLRSVTISVRGARTNLVLAGA